MWKDFFYYSKSERRAILLLLILLAALVGTCVFFPGTEEEATAMPDGEAIKEIKTFLTGIHEREQKKYPRYTSHKPERMKVVLSSFDPNLSDSIELLRLGLPTFIVRNILKYRDAGGKFRSAEDFSRIYGLTAEKFKVLKPYIFISAAFQRKPDTLYQSESRAKRDTLAFYKYPEGTLVDVNHADTTELKKIPGIGRGIAAAIVNYRHRLGGFYDLSQLREIKYVNEDMMKWFKLEHSPVHRINANKAGLDKLRSHPYLDFYQAKVILEYRRKIGKLKSLSQLSLYEEFTEKDLERLSHYLTFD